ncbi:MAG: PqqA peptide cyclase [Candidatus Scalindua arabica]|uniref:PqqA peptide cyclase n=1 Tax=Candidatus Scalindua arabica TaxID=1127984 RepID=A0A941VYT7_9BACT|nr:PqqA peptide cyclase [Candidatus Scalindua arabica]
MKSIPHVISWNLTKACNLLCSHCYILADNIQQLDQTNTNLSDATSSQHTLNFNQMQCTTQDTGDELDTVASLKVIDEIAELNPNLILILTGGEPLLRKDIFDLSRHASRKGMMVLLGTNACLINDDVARKLKDNGFSGIGISLDSIHPDVHDSIRGMKGSWKSAIEGMKACKMQGLEIQIQTTVFKKNYDEIPELVAFANEMGARVFNLFFLVCTGRGQDITDITSEQYEDALKQIYKLHNQYEGTMLVSAKCAPHYRRIAYEMNPESALVKYYSGGCPAGTNYCRITPEGNVTPCPYMDTSCGNLKEKSFEEIWNNSGILKELRESDLKGRCGECEFESMCKGCRARALVTTGDQMEEDSWCDYEPGKHGGKKLTFKEENTFGLDKEFELSWSEDAKKRLGRVPSFGKGMVIKRVEQYAREEGYSEITPDIMKEAKEKMAVDKKAMFPFMNLLKKKPAKNGKIEWETEAQERVKNAPDFVRPGIYKLMEKRAKEKGYKVITSAFLSEIRDESMQFASRRMNKLGFDELDMEAFDTAKAKTKNKKKKEVIDDIKDFLAERNVKNTEIIKKFQKYLSTETDGLNTSKK